MNIAKKIIKNAFETGLEHAKDSAKEGGKQILEAVNPVHALPNKPVADSSNEIGEYLKNLADPSLKTQQAIQTRQQQEEEETEQKVTQLRQILHGKQITPSPEKEKERIYDTLWRERQEKEAALKQQQDQKPFAEAAGKKKGRLGGPMHQKAATGMETKVNVKTG